MNFQGKEQMFCLWQWKMRSFHEQLSDAKITKPSYKQKIGATVFEPRYDHIFRRYHYTHEKTVTV